MVCVYICAQPLLVYSPSTIPFRAKYPPKPQKEPPPARLPVCQLLGIRNTTAHSLESLWKGKESPGARTVGQLQHWLPTTPRALLAQLFNFLYLPWCQFVQPFGGSSTQDPILQWRGPHMVM